MTEVAVLGAGGGVRAEGAVPAVAGVAVGVAGVVDPAPVGVKRHPGLNCAGVFRYYLLSTYNKTFGAALSSLAHLYWHLGGGILLNSARSLALDREKQKGENEFRNEVHTPGKIKHYSVHVLICFLNI